MGCLTHFDENNFFSIRTIVVENAEGKLIIAEFSLTKIMSHKGSNNKFFIIKIRITEKKITSIKFLLKNLAILEFYCAKSNKVVICVMDLLINLCLIGFRIG